MILPKGKKIYRGSYFDYSKPFSSNRRAVYFANTRNNAEIYSGFVTEYTLTKNAHVLNMGDANTVRKLIGMAASDRLKHHIKKAFRVANNSNNVRRFSKMKYDAYVAEFICRLGYDGYYAPRLRTKLPQGSFGSEIVLCDPSTFLKVSHVFEPTRSPNTRLGRNNSINISKMNYTVV